MDENYQTYINRVARLTLPAAYQSQLANIQESPKYKLDEQGQRQPVPFPGYTIVAPPWKDDRANQEIYETLKSCQESLLPKLDPGLFIPVPPESFHLTLADLIWDNAYQTMVNANPQFDSQLQATIQDIFGQVQDSVQEEQPLRWQVMGLMLRPRAIAVCLLPKDEATYERVLKFRRALYQNEALISLGIEQEYGFTAHITLGYFGAIPEKLDRESISEMFMSQNDRWIGSPLELKVSRAELRKFEDMTSYDRQSDWPVLEFCR